MVDTGGNWVPARRLVKCSPFGGVGIGGVLEPLQANPTIIEDNCFYWRAFWKSWKASLSKKGSVISMGIPRQSTKIYDRETGGVHLGRIPAGSVVVSGNLPSKTAPEVQFVLRGDREKVDAKTRGKVGINELLRTID